MKTPKQIFLSLKNLIIPEYQNTHQGGIFGGFFGDIFQKGKASLFLLLHKMGFPNFDAPLWLFFQLYKTGWGRKYIEFSTKIAWRYRPVVKEFSSKGGQLTNTPAFSRAANEMLNPDMIKVLGVNGVQNKLMDAYNKMRVGRYGCIILQFDDIGKYDYSSFKLAVGRPGNRKLVDFFSVTEQYITPNFEPTTGEVLNWDLQLSNGQFTIHNDRVIHLTKNGEFYHTPDFQYAWSDLVALVNLSVASAFSSASATSKTIISMKSAPTNSPKNVLYPSASSSVLSANDLHDQGREFAEGVSPVLIVVGEEAQAQYIPPQTLDITAPQKPHIGNLAAFLDIPESFFLGHIVGERAGDKDKVTLDELSKMLREGITESLFAPFFNRLIQLSLLPAPRPVKRKAINGNSIEESVYNIEWVAPIEKTESESDSDSASDNKKTNDNDEELNNDN